jgi:hypothetical protein
MGKLLRTFAFSFGLALGTALISSTCVLSGSEQAFAILPQIQQESYSSSVQEIGEAISARLVRVQQFAFIREEAEKLGVKAYLFGGSAAGFGHYVKWDLARAKGDTRFQPDRFDYDYSNIYRSNQDLDIVIDGPAEKEQALKNVLSETYPHLEGSKINWDVRLLREKMNGNEALLNNPDFLNQHTDSNSTGLIEITRPSSGESVVRDLRDWNSKEPFFLKDIQAGKLHYYHSPTHAQTGRAAQGLNPPILSAIRYLTKAFQYELQIGPRDLKSIQKVIQDFNAEKDLRNPYVSDWIEKNGKKLIQNAVNIEYAWNTLESLGLRRKLIEINNTPGTQESLAWWLDKEPLRSKPLGSSGMTAKEVFEKHFPGKPLVIAHETNNLIAFDSITRAHTGDPNVLISRKGYPGETAEYGDGFYTRVGREGARRTGNTIRFELDPQARLGTDFTMIDDYLVIQNRNALRVIPESLNIGIVEYFEMLARGNGLGFGSGDQAILKKQKRRLNGNVISKQDEKKILEFI